MSSMIGAISSRALRVWQRNRDVYFVTWKTNMVPPLMEPVLYLLAFGGLYLAGAMDVYGFLCTLVFTSFRISGSYVLNTIIKRPFNGLDWGLVGFIALLAVSHYGLLPMGVLSPASHAALPYIACLYLVGRNLLDFVRQYSTINSPVEPA